MAINEFAHILWEATRRAIGLTDNKFVTRFFQTKGTPPAPWNARAFVLHFNVKLAHIAGSVNTAADFLSRLELNITEKICTQIRENIKTGELGSLWHKHISITVRNYNTSYQASNDCETSRVFHGRIPYNVVDLKLGIRPQKTPMPIPQVAQSKLEQTEMTEINPKDDKARL